MDKSRGGLSTKIHAAVDALGNPVRFLLTAGQTSEYTQAEALIAGFEAGYVLADKGYDSDAFISAIAESQAMPVIPARKNRKVPRELDRDLYKERNRVERCFQKLKHFRRIATRYERLARIRRCSASYRLSSGLIENAPNQCAKLSKIRGGTVG
jgi:transposase